MTSGDWMPPQAPFDMVRRGYSPEQVTAHLERLEYDLRIATANRDATNVRLSELTSQLSAAQAEVDTLRTELDRAALEPVSMSGLSERMQRMIRLAEEEAGEIRARAEADSAKSRSQLDGQLAESAQARSDFDIERERTRKQLAEQVHGLIGEATAEAESTRTQAQEESARLLQEANTEAEHTVSEARRFAEQTVTEARASADAMLLLATTESEQLRTETREATDRLTAESTAERDRLNSESAAERERLTAESTAERERLVAEGVEHRKQVQDDFEIAIASRRAEANRVITDREQTSQGTARQLVADATARAEKTVADAEAEADLLMRRATTYANALVNHAAQESAQRVTDADQAVAALLDLRTRVTEQLTSLAGHLDHIRGLAGAAPAMLTPPADEQTRPRAQDFPPEPGARPTPIDAPFPVLQTGPDAAGPAATAAVPPRTPDGALLLDDATPPNGVPVVPSQPAGSGGWVTPQDNADDTDRTQPGADSVSPDPAEAVAGSVVVDATEQGHQHRNGRLRGLGVGHRR